jgi:phosphoribosylformylglycinamidine cyclo-ligase
MATYKDAGVDRDAANETVKAMKKHVKSTYNKNVLSTHGNFGGLYKLDKYNNPVLVSSMDGVGTKLKIAFMANKHDSVGQCLVNHCVNDILVQGATPLFFLDYFSVGRLQPDVATEIVKGFSMACKENSCVLIGGETAEMPDLYRAGEYDLAGCIIGAVEKDNIITGKKIKPGDKIIGLKSSGLHTNGYSLARQVLLDKYDISSEIEELGCTLGEELLKIHTSYLEVVKPHLNKLKGLAHITGGGLVENIPRILPKDVNAKLNKSSWEILPIFKLIQKEGNVPEDDMFRTFNMGIGMVLIVDKETEISEGIVIGEIVEGNGVVELI